MKSVFALALVLAAFQPMAEASKARLDSLQRSTQLVDSQLIFYKPSQIHLVGQFLTFEMGGTGTTGVKAEGGFLRTDGDAKYGVYLGHMSEYQNTYRASGYKMGGTFLAQQNPVSFMYGKADWGLVVDVSNSDKKSTKEKETTLGIRFGQSNNGNTYYVSLDAIGTAENGTTNNKMSTNGLGLGYEKDMGAWYYGAALDYAMIKTDIGATSESGNEMVVSLSALNRELKTDKADIYYGAGLDLVDGKIGAGKRSSLSIPLFLGIEHQTNSWLVSRVSVAQPLFLSSSKDEVNAAPPVESDTTANATRVAAGVGIKYGEFTLDGSLTAAADGNINGNKILSQAALTYTF